MSGVVEYHEKLEEQRELAALLKALLEADVIEDGPAQGIARQVIDKGEDSLSEKQRFVFQKHVKEPLCQPECERCGARIPVAEAWDLEQGDTASACSSCKHDYDRIMRE